MKKYEVLFGRAAPHFGFFILHSSFSLLFASLHNQECAGL